ncbi:Spx/MgsR family RNA polymerase-binding regulatory protein [Calothrix sp. PCC 6303]|uniref:Spx/MgsR family RNA polymerase-binding regulatory protein n=1 Tax=Calothrix sp. PCC 6303 TaxID=1170562 RepID=UPI0002A01E12|nr:Spx/MgsR family RNA polymerase-binding regulatory protein [Calothrix sp. PCC 6303]AFZ03486.1 ArsC family protein [Calothrix sp. PCC 6303]
MSIQVYGIPTCGTCKKAMQWLDKNHVKYKFINTKEHPPNESTIREWVKTLGFQPMRNTSGQSYRTLGEEKKQWQDEQWIKAFAEDAMLLKRPLFVKDETAVMVGFRDPDDVIRQKLAISPNLN